VFNAAGQVFLQKRSHKKDRQPGVWDSSASGHLDSGEDYDACALRELREEIGLQLKAAPRRLFKLAASAQTDQEHVWVYRCEAEGPFRLDPDEIEQGSWFAPEAVTRWMAERPRDFASALLVIWKKGANLDSTTATQRTRARPSGCFRALQLALPSESPPRGSRTGPGA